MTNKNIEKRIARLESIVSSPGWNGRITAVRNVDNSYDVIVNDSEGNREAFTASFSVFLKIKAKGNFNIVIVQ